MLLHHGTTRRCAEQIAIKGFAPRKPSRRVWFAQSKGYALRRAKVKARRSHDRPVVLLCELDLGGTETQARQQARGVTGRASSPSTAACRSRCCATRPGCGTRHLSEPELAAWLNNVLGLKACRGIGRARSGTDTPRSLSDSGRKQPICWKIAADW